MKIVLLNKIPILKMFRSFFTLEFGVIEYAELLDRLCEQIEGDVDDRQYIRPIVYSDVYFQGHHEPFTDGQKERMMDFFMKVRAHILFEIQQNAKFSVLKKISFIPSDSFMSIKFEVLE